MTQTPRSSTVEGPAADAEPPAGGEVPRRPALSPSRAADFKQCPLLYRFRAIDRLPERPTLAQVRGTLVHAVLEHLHGLPAAGRAPAAAHALVGPTWAQLSEADPALLAALAATGDGTPEAEGAPDAESSAHSDGSALPEGSALSDSPETGAVTALLDGAHTLLDAYFTLEDPRRVEPEARELLVEAELASGLLLRGYVDRLDRAAPGPPGPDGAPTESPAADRPTHDGPAHEGTTGDTAADGPVPAAAWRGDYAVVDYKTGAAPRPTSEARALFQMKFYALVLLLLRGRAPTELRLMYLTRPEALSYVPDEAQLHRFGRTLQAMWVAIRAAGASGDFRPNPGPACSWCDHRARCPAWGGTPPPYPGWPGEADGP